MMTYVQDFNRWIEEYVDFDDVGGVEDLVNAVEDEEDIGDWTVWRAENGLFVRSDESTDLRIASDNAEDSFMWTLAKHAGDPEYDIRSWIARQKK